MNTKFACAAVAFAVSASAVLATSAEAADLPSRRAPPVFAPPPPIPVFSWTGLYIGLQAGYEFGRDNAFSRSTVTGAGLASSSSSPSGVIGGGHVGYNFSTQSLPVFGSAFGTGGVIGLEGDVDGASARRAYGIGPLIGASYREPIQGSIRGRLGIAFDRVLVYGTGGAAFGTFRNSYTTAVASDSLERTRVGYTVGGGVEYAMTNNIAIRAEYRYSDFGAYTDVLVNTTGGGVAVRHRDTDNRVQAGISYKFDTPVLAPVVARY